MDDKEFYDLCRQKAVAEGAAFPDLDAQCLECGRRIAAHAKEEFERCAKSYDREE